MSKLAPLSTVVRLAGATVNTVATWLPSIDPDEGLTLSSALEQRLVNLVDSGELSVVPSILEDLALNLRVGPACEVSICDFWSGVKE